MNQGDGVKKVAVVDDTRVFRNDFAQVCESMGIQCVQYCSANEATAGLLPLLRRPTRIQMAFIDCSLITQPPGQDTDGVRLAEELCKSKRMRGVAIYMYTRFLSPVPDYAQLKTALSSLVEGFRASSRDDLNGKRKVINKDVDDCLRDIDEGALLRSGLDRIARL